MLNFIASPVYLACGATDMRKSIDGLAAMVQEQFGLNPFSSALFVFCTAGSSAARFSGPLAAQLHYV
ncbi:IS66 family insertion sequence element accessory protein TnpB [Paenibacillus popilliae]|uniref:IS66 family insertion sequence element accessory protein TnpB n=1 Tax=Paenibacillus popilliae TaxID=78057 RepID=UPI0002F332AC|nr:IS66 family insertion sequence element accessory protein TnpB [Paenibacillus popilliae]